ncbi:Det1 complexing ubiquitin ligase [Zea mays]|jgi:hypothetical protein|uniref:Det1 complexing ubiquitin ligase n=1 Tax=Zea mays TaxID=4577 RepID=A0A1D6JM73_MAIZE|nr:Det1 complexing ubiquitin ligase [Zea mays]ONL93166.1 Det1 complexing ubiquitin ligase [Zea mays]ONL93170.1 Det1 complexing ubiquitin ligase [Zea mays]
MIVRLYGAHDIFSGRVICEQLDNSKHLNGYFSHRLLVRCSDNSRDIPICIADKCTEQTVGILLTIYMHDNSSLSLSLSLSLSSKFPCTYHTTALFYICI